MKSYKISVVYFVFSILSIGYVQASKYPAYPFGRSSRIPVTSLFGRRLFLEQNEVDPAILAQREIENPRHPRGVLFQEVLPEEAVGVIMEGIRGIPDHAEAAEDREEEDREEEDREEEDREEEDREEGLGFLDNLQEEENEDQWASFFEASQEEASQEEERALPASPERAVVPQEEERVLVFSPEKVINPEAVIGGNEPSSSEKVLEEVSPQRASNNPEEMRNVSSSRKESAVVAEDEPVVMQSPEKVVNSGAAMSSSFSSSEKMLKEGSPQKASNNSEEMGNNAAAALDKEAVAGVPSSPQKGEDIENEERPLVPSSPKKDADQEDSFVEEVLFPEIQSLEELPSLLAFLDKHFAGTLFAEHCVPQRFARDVFFSSKVDYLTRWLEKVEKAPMGNVLRRVWSYLVTLSSNIEREESGRLLTQFYRNLGFNTDAKSLQKTLETFIVPWLSKGFSAWQKEDAYCVKALDLCLQRKGQKELLPAAVTNLYTELSKDKCAQATKAAEIYGELPAIVHETVVIMTAKGVSEAEIRDMLGRALQETKQEERDVILARGLKKARRIGLESTE